MKKSASLLLAAIIGLALFSFSRAPHAGQPPSVRGAVVIVGQQTYTNGLPENMRVYLSSSSVGGPQIPSGTSLGDAIAVFLNEGYRFDHVEGLVVYMSK